MSREASDTRQRHAFHLYTIDAGSEVSCTSISVISFNLSLHFLHTPEGQSNTTYTMENKTYLTQLVRTNQSYVR